MYQREQIIRLVCASVSVRVAAGTEADIARELPLFEDNLKALTLKINAGKNKGWVGDSRRVKDDLFANWDAVVTHGSILADSILSTRSIPKQHIKAFEMSYRLLNNIVKQPKNMYDWFDLNQKRFDLVVQAARTWPPKQEGSDDLFIVGSFKVHNTVGAEGAEIESLKSAIECVDKLCRKNSVPGLVRTLYGDIHVVARITKAHHAAWYFSSDDSLYLRRSKTTGIDEVHAIIHELGHRYWQKFASEEDKKSWRRHHEDVEAKPVDLDLPTVGDPIPIKIPKIEKYPTITKIDGGRYHYEVDIGEGEVWRNSISAMRVWQIYSDQQRALKNFPTEYSTKSAEEHFCEALALSAMGTLKPEHQIPFDAIWNA